MLHSAAAGKEPPMWLLGGGAHRTKLRAVALNNLICAVCSTENRKHKLTQ